MDIIEAIILGIVQGLTEFIPVSSSGHLVIFSKVLGFKSQGITFEIMLHVATLLAVIIIFRNDLRNIIKKPFSKVSFLIITASLFTGIIYMLFKDLFFELFESGEYVGQAMVFTGIVLFFSDSLYKEEAPVNTLRKISYLDAAIVGILQGIAIIPGVSRSGITICGGMLRKMDRNNALRFSFLLSIPAILAAFASDIIEVSGNNVGLEIELMPLIAGVIAAFFSGYLAIRFLIRFINKRGLRPFSYYVFSLGILVLLDQHLFGIFL